MSDVEQDRAQKLFNWFGLSVGFIGLEKTEMMLQALLEQIQSKKRTESGSDEQ